MKRSLLLCVVLYVDENMSSVIDRLLSSIQRVLTLVAGTRDELQKTKVLLAKRY